MITRSVLTILVCILSHSCAHKNRVSPRTINRLAIHHEEYVLVFGSMLPAQGAVVKPLIRFVHQLNRNAPMYILHEMKVDNGGRFYAILKPPAQLQRVDQFETEVNWGPGFDKINFVRVAKRNGPLGVYLGEIQMVLAKRGDAPGYSLAVTARDDFVNAVKELHQLYPKFDGTIVKAPVTGNPRPATSAPKPITIPIK